jgi:hypothetical protein
LPHVQRSEIIQPAPAGESPIYKAKYGWNRQSAKVIGGSLAFCVVMLVIPAPLWARIFVVGFFGLCALIITAASLTRRTALRIDSAGVALCQSPLQPRSAAFYPWEDVEKILIWQFQRLRHVGVQRREGAAPLSKRVRPTSRAALARTSPGIPLEAAATAVAASGWFLDPERPADAVARFAPTVEVLDITTDRLLNHADQYQIDDERRSDTQGRN